MLSNQPNAPLTVSQLNRQVKQLLETQYPSVPVQGEISTLSRPASGHIYFTLKDQNAQIRCAMFKGSLSKSKYIPKQGDEVVAFGRLSLYEGRGDYQLIVNAMQPVGEGALQAAFFQMKERLATEGLFDETRKKPLPESVKSVGIVTSSTGAALHDILTVLNKRFPAMDVILYPSQVQGNEAARTIVGAIETANRRKEVDVLVVGRGGGSLEDLWCFNTEPVARAIYNSDIPIVSAVGHEVDVSIADFVADIRAATPSQAAELISPDQFEIIQKVDQLEQRFAMALLNQLSAYNIKLSQLRKRLRGPDQKVMEWREKLNNITKRLFISAQRPVTSSRERFNTLEKRLSLMSPKNRIEQDKVKVSQLSERLIRSSGHIVENKETAFQKTVAKLNLLSPLATLDRGYSITRDSTQSIVQNANNLKVNDEIETLLKEGKVISVVKSIDHGTLKD
jgi:exodeoxyribonuclease VII large subunit